MKKKALKSREEKAAPPKRGKRHHTQKRKEGNATPPMQHRTQGRMEGEEREREGKQHPPKKGANHHMTSIYLALLQSWLVEFEILKFGYIIFF